MKVGNTGYYTQSPGVCYDGDTLIAQWRINVESLGSGYNVSPVATLTSDEGSGAELITSLRTRLSTMTVTNQGKDYGDKQPVTVNVAYEYETNDGTDTLTSGTVQTWDIISLVDGTIPATIIIPEAKMNLFNTTWRVIGWKVEFVDAGTEAAATVMTSGSLYGMYLTEGGYDYISEPTIALTGNAKLSFEYVKVAYAMDVDNSGVTAPYAWTPVLKEVQFFGRTSSTKEAVNTAGWSFSYETEPLTNCEIVNGTTIQRATLGDLKSQLTTDDDGNVVWVDQAVKYITGRSSMEPQIYFNESLQPFMAMANVQLNADGEVSGLSVPNTGVNGPLNYYESYGIGYSKPFGVTIEPTIAGLPGTGAMINLDGRGYFATPTYYQWNSTNNIVVNGGSGYLQNVNQTGKVNFSGNGTMNVSAGGTYVNDVMYGTG